MQTTKKQFDSFKKSCREWILKLNLNNWQFHFELGEVPKGMIATSEWIYSNKFAVIVLNEQYSMELNDDVLNKIAFHEVFHVLLSGYNYLLDNNLSKKEFIDPIDHDVIRTIENLIFKHD